MNFIIVTGMSGAGKSTALNVFEDLSYYCVDNMPAKLIKNLADFCLEGGSGIENVALGIDARSKLSHLVTGLEALEQQRLPYSILYLDAEDAVLQTRYKETRRTHPLGQNIMEGIEKERRLLEEIRQRATHRLDTSLMRVWQLREKIVEIFVDRREFGGLMVHVQSFGFKYGIPPMSDLVFDVRFLPNPFYDPALKSLTGMDAAVRDFVMQSEVSRKFLADLSDMMHFLLPQYTKEGKNQLVISVGCTGGKHRSVTMARGLHDALQTAGYPVVINHRDITKT